MAGMNDWLRGELDRKRNRLSIGAQQADAPAEEPPVPEPPEMSEHERLWLVAKFLNGYSEPQPEVDAPPTPRANAGAGHGQEGMGQVKMNDVLRAAVKEASLDRRAVERAGYSSGKHHW